MLDDETGCGVPHIGRRDGAPGGAGLARARAPRDPTTLQDLGPGILARKAKPLAQALPQRGLASPSGIGRCAARRGRKMRVFSLLRIFAPPGLGARKDQVNVKSTRRTDFAMARAPPGAFITSASPATAKRCYPLWNSCWRLRMFERKQNWITMVAVTILVVSIAWCQPGAATLSIETAFMDIEVQRGSLTIVRPLCPKCRKSMWLICIETLEPKFEMRTFECASCGAEKQIMVELL